MLALRKILGNVDPHQGRVEIQYQPRVEAVAYPHFAHSSVILRPHTMGPENYSYALEAACRANYVAEGSISFPALSGSICYFAFRTSHPWSREWHLTLGEDPTKISGTMPEYVVKEFLRRADLGQPRQRNDLADIIAKNIGDYFLHDSSAPQPRGADYIQRVTHEIKVMAANDYYSILENLLNENCRQHLQPQKYLYELSPEEVLDKNKLKRFK